MATTTKTVGHHARPDAQRPGGCRFPLRARQWRPRRRALAKFPGQWPSCPSPASAIQTADHRAPAAGADERYRTKGRSRSIRLPSPCNSCPLNSRQLSPRGPETVAQRQARPVHAFSHFLKFWAIAWPAGPAGARWRRPHLVGRDLAPFVGRRPALDFGGPGGREIAHSERGQGQTVFECFDEIHPIVAIQIQRVPDDLVRGIMARASASNNRLVIEPSAVSKSARRGDSPRRF